jgi:hypothetical protein
MQPECSSPCSQQPAIGPHFEPINSSSRPQILFLLRNCLFEIWHLHSCQELHGRILTPCSLVVIKVLEKHAASILRVYLSAFPSDVWLIWLYNAPKHRKPFTILHAVIGWRPKYALSHYPHIYALIFQAVHFLNAFRIKLCMFSSFSRPRSLPLAYLPLSACRINISIPINCSCIIPVYNILQFVARYGMSVHLPDYTVSKTRTQQYEYSPS